VAYHNTYRISVGGVPSEDVLPVIQSVSRFGYLGVSLFFLISGFVILWSASAKTPRQFAASRALRLYPSFWAALLLTLLALVLLGSPGSLPDLWTILSNLTMLPGYMGSDSVDGVYWTLAVEMKFYFLVTMLILLRQIPHVERWIWGWLAGLAVCEAGIRVPGLISLTLFPFGSLFAGGCWAYLIRLRGVSTARLAGFLVSALLSVLAAAPEARSFMHSASGAEVLVAQLLVVGCYLLTLSVALRWWRTRYTAIAVTLGALTYPLYLVHNRIGKLIYAATEHQLPVAVRVVLITIIALMLAWLLTWLVERKLVGAIGRSGLYRRIAGLRVR
jgi:peptidoglycan/LPS O-acetylase OafA/YrhL